MKWAVLAAVTASVMWAQPGDPYAKCLACHATTAPPLSLVYRRYLMLYSAKARIADRMVRFLTHSSKAASSMPEGMKNRFNPENHPAFTTQEAQKAVAILIDEEDLIKRLVIPTEASPPADRE
ncbi:hypothetical protein [Hydrogenimonas sp.]